MSFCRDFSWIELVNRFVKKGFEHRKLIAVIKNTTFEHIYTFYEDQKVVFDKDRFEHIMTTIESKYSDLSIKNQVALNNIQACIVVASAIDIFDLEPAPDAYITVAIYISAVECLMTSKFIVAFLAIEEIHQLAIYICDLYKRTTQIYESDGKEFTTREISPADGVSM